MINLSDTQRHDLRRTAYFCRHPRKYFSWKQKRALIADEGYSLRPFDEARCIFVHIPKCAGISVSTSLFGNLGGGHTDIKTYERIYSSADFESYFKFTFVRNPWDRLVSAYLFLKKGGLGKRDKHAGEWLFAGCEDINQFVLQRLEDPEVISWRHFRPQVDYLRNSRGEIKMDFIGHFESLDSDYQHIAERLGTGTPLAKMNATRADKKAHNAVLNDRAREQIARVYRDDIESFGYSLNVTI